MRIIAAIYAIIGTLLMVVCIIEDTQPSNRSIFGAVMFWGIWIYFDRKNR